MKKSLLFVVALLVSAMSFANIVINAETDKAFISSYKDEARAFTIDEVAFGQIACQYNANTFKIGELEIAAKQFVQLRKAQEGKPSGQIYNTDAINLGKLTILQLKEKQKEFKLLAGASAEDLAEVVIPEAEAVKHLITLKDESSEEVDADKFVFDLSGKQFFKIENVDNNPVNIISIEIEDSKTSLIDNSVVALKAVKVIENGQLVIIRDGVRYNTVGQVIE